jgi:hypothetical protein
VKLTRIALASVALLSTGVVGASCSTAKSAPSSSTTEGRQLVGLFRLRPGTDEDGQLSGSWFQMVEPGGTVAGGPYMKNASSSAEGGDATLLTPGTAGGLRTGSYQSQPNPAFDAGGNALADSILAPTEFSGIKFGVSTNRIDPQTNKKVPPPTVVLHDGVLTANVSSWAVSWSRQNFNQGAPKPSESSGATSTAQPQATIARTSATGAIDTATGHFYLEWTSLIVRGPFNGFTGVWHLQGVYSRS